jgi:hypothetical protein
MAENGSNGGNGGRNFQIAQLASTGVLLIAMFGLWWQSADPRARLDKIEVNQADNRKELNESLSGLRKEISQNYTSFREHTDLISRLKSENEELAKKIDMLLPKAEFNSWKEERSVFATEQLRRMGKIEERFDVHIKDAISRAEYLEKWKTEEKFDDGIGHRIDLVIEQLEKIRENTVPNSLVTAQNNRIEQLFTLLREVQQHVFEITSNTPNHK